MWPVAAAVVAAVAAVVVALVVPGGAPPRAVPAFALPAAAGGAPISYRPPPPGGSGRPMVLAFFASWCGPCHVELPAVARQVARLQHAGTPIRFVAVDGNDTASAGLAFAHRSGVTFPVAEDETQSLARKIGLVGLPDTVFVDRSGHIVHIMQGSGFSAATFRRWAAAIASS